MQYIRTHEYMLDGDYHIPIQIRMPTNEMKNFTISPSTNPSEIYAILAEAVEIEIQRRYGSNSNTILGQLKTADAISEHLVAEIKKMMQPADLETRFKSFKEKARAAQSKAQKTSLRSAIIDLNKIIGTIPKGKAYDELDVDVQNYIGIKEVIKKHGNDKRAITGAITKQIGDYYESIIAEALQRTEDGMKSAFLHADVTGGKTVKLHASSTRETQRKVDVLATLNEELAGFQATIGLNIKGQFPVGNSKSVPRSKFLETSSNSMKILGGWTAELINFLAYKRLSGELTASSPLAKQIGAANSSLAIGGFLGHNLNDRALFIIKGNQVQSLSQMLREMEKDARKQVQMEIPYEGITLRSGKENLGQIVSKKSKKTGAHNIVNTKGNRSSLAESILTHYYIKKAILASYNVRFNA